MQLTAVLCAGTYFSNAFVHTPICKLHPVPNTCLSSVLTVHLTTCHLCSACLQAVRPARLTCLAATFATAVL